MLMLKSTFATTIIIAVAVAHFDDFIQFTVALPYQEVVCKRRFGTTRAVIVVIVFSLVGIIIVIIIIIMVLSGSVFGDRKVFGQVGGRGRIVAGAAFAEALLVVD
jgi:hypothetical protein